MKEEECVMEEKSQSRDAVRQRERAGELFFSPLSKLVLALLLDDFISGHTLPAHTV